MGIPRDIIEGQLHMLWPLGQRVDPESLRLPDGYALRPGLRAAPDHPVDPASPADHADHPGANSADVASFRALMTRVGLGTWDDEQLTQVHKTVVPNGWQVVVHQPSGVLVATGMAQHNPIDDLYSDGYEVGWIAADPDHSGRGLGRVVTAAALQRLLDAKARCIYLRSDDFRLPALKTYLALGFLPHLYTASMPARWEAVCERLSWPFIPELWPRAEGVPP